MDSPSICSFHGYAGFMPCIRCVLEANSMKGGPPEKPPVVLNGERVRFEIRTKSKPWWIPGFVWNGLCKLVIRNVNIIAVTENRRT